MGLTPMEEALRLAKQGLYSTSPNPRVGCVIICDGQQVGSGWHSKAGEPHAEIIALNQAGDKAEGADVYITLEPCCHQGKTAPCTEALIKAKVAKVYIAISDPNPLVDGKGIARLKQAGIAVNTGLLAEEAAELNKGFIQRYKKGRPWIRLKMAQSLDGATAFRNANPGTNPNTSAADSPCWITGEEARKDVHHWRAQSCAVITGAATLNADNSRLNARLETTSSLQPLTQPLRIVLDTNFTLSPDAAFFTTPGAKLWIGADNQDNKYNKEHHKNQAALPTAPTETEVITLPHNEKDEEEEKGGKDGKHKKHKSGIQLASVVERLAQRGINELMVESGARLAGAFLTADLVDEFILYISPCIMGTKTAPLMELTVNSMKDAYKFKIIDERFFDKDIRFVLRPRVS